MAAMIRGDPEAIALLALDLAREGAGTAATTATGVAADGDCFGNGLTADHLRRAIADFIPSQHTDTIQLMELLAVQEVFAPQPDAGTLPQHRPGGGVSTDRGTQAKDRARE